MENEIMETMNEEVMDEEMEQVTAEKNGDDLFFVGAAVGALALCAGQFVWGHVIKPIGRKIKAKKKPDKIIDGECKILDDEEEENDSEEKVEGSKKGGKK